MAAVVSNTSDTTTAADKAAALTFLKINYNWPNNIQFGTGEDASVYTLNFVMNNNTGTIGMNVLKPTGEFTNEHCGVAYLDATAMVEMSDEERNTLVTESAEAVVAEHLDSKKKFIKAQMAAIEAGDIVEINGVKHVVSSVKNQTLHMESEETKSKVKDKINMWKGQLGNAQQQTQQEQGKSAFAGLLGAIGAIGSGMGGFAGLGLGKEAVEAQKLIQDLQNQQAELAKKTINPIVKPYYDKVGLDNLKANTKMSFAQKYQNQYAEEQDYVYSDDDYKYQETKMPKAVSDILKPSKIAVDDGFKDTSNDEQKFIQRVGVMSNLNVSIQGKKRIGITVYRLFCDKCKTPRDIEAGVITQRRIEDKVLVEFCNTHRHVSIVPQAGGERKFKDV